MPEILSIFKVVMDGQSDGWLDAGGSLHRLTSNIFLIFLLVKEMVEFSDSAIGSIRFLK